MKLLITSCAMALVVAACGGGDVATVTTPDDGQGHVEDAAATTMAMEHDEEFAWGEPADPAMATRVIEIAGGDDFRFDPAVITVAVGEVITFRLTNVGAIPHELVLGDADMQAEHEVEMAAMGDGGMEHGEPNELDVESGETSEITFKFTQAAALQFGCHEPGHFAAGMVGTLIVTG